VHGARAAQPEDLAELDRLAGEAIDELRPARGGDLWWRTLGRRPPHGPSLAAAIAAADVLVLCGTIDDAVVGYGVTRLDELADGSVLAVIEDLYTTPEARHVGVGEAMMDRIVAWATERGACGVDALALPGMRDTKNFFESFGLVARAIVVHRPLS
jgi:GNAT superfamily N-acetyltransferase